MTSALGFYHQNEIPKAGHFKGKETYLTHSSRSSKAWCHLQLGSGETEWHTMARLCEGKRYHKARQETIE
jgi:hypothetical protein